MITEKELQDIREEAEKLYPPPQNEGEGFERYFQTMTRIRQYQRDTYISALTRERERVKGLVEAQDEYIKLLTDELTDMAGMAYVHGWRSTRVEKGQELRDKISQFKL